MEYMTPASNEAVQDIASVYNNDKLIATNIIGSTGTLGGIKLSNGWSTTSDSNEISNDTDVYKTLMIVGNRSGGDKRRISMWDDVAINGSLSVSNRNILNELNSLRSDVTNLQNTVNDINNNYIRNGKSIYIKLLDGDNRYVNLQKNVIVSDNPGANAYFQVFGNIFKT
ncbi:MAG: tail fiber domain-containing protein [Terrestrivirus sp.]|uniref:Tail fiber domain-containing protein n=1 Tax=Terrestrivirus sp. TaxID=2487775 RepID=A0A3G4ZPC0_9VIRU|nr:MAG: tail fiber domain-containing protein [Terrestrivirus sp.]